MIFHAFCLSCIKSNMYATDDAGCLLGNEMEIAGNANRQAALIAVRSTETTHLLPSYFSFLSLSFQKDKKRHKKSGNI